MLLHFGLELMEMSVTLMEVVLCNKLPVLFIFFTVKGRVHVVEGCWNMLLIK